MTKASDFSEWYNDVIDQAGIVDKRYPVQGMNVWTPYGLQVMKLIDSHMRAEMARTGHQEVLFPTLIPEDLFKRETEHIKGFEKGVFWVTHGGTTPLEVRLLLRPTSEAAMYDMFRLWIRSHADLPLKLFQIVSTFRYETKQTRAFLRVREIHFFEGHTAHATYQEAEAQIREDLGVMENLGRALAVPYIVHRRPEWDKFPGAYYSLGVDTFVAEAERALQVATIHEYKDNFAKAYDVKYEDAKGKHHFVHQTTYGMSERLLGSVIALHGDEKGIVLPPSIAPTQVVIVPIPAKGQQAEVEAVGRAVLEEIQGMVRAHLDLRDLRPGAKFFEWERKGVPLRVEVGTRDMAAGTVTVVRRDTGAKAALERGTVPRNLRSLLEAIQGDLLAHAQEILGAQVHEVKDLGRKRPEGILRMAWCGREECGKEMETKLDLTILGEPLGVGRPEGACVACGQVPKLIVDGARTY